MCHIRWWAFGSGRITTSSARSKYLYVIYIKYYLYYYHSPPSPQHQDRTCFVSATLQSFLGNLDIDHDQDVTWHDVTFAHAVRDAETVLLRAGQAVAAQSQLRAADASRPSVTAAPPLAYKSYKPALIGVGAADPLTTLPAQVIDVGADFALGAGAGTRTW